jgi:4-amino-4-deoxy-L-arabinose transferase-like glycosyltransferase
MDTKDGQRIEVATPRRLPYRWGYFQGVLVIPFSLFLLLGTTSELLKARHNSTWYESVVVLLMGLVGVPLGVGLLQKKKYALNLVYLMFSLALLQAAIQIPIAVAHFADQSDKGSAFFEAEMLFVWLLSLLYYRKRQEQFT